MTVSAHDIARELRSRFDHTIGRAKLQKLLYYCQGWHLAHYGSPMFEEDVEAWREGPVVPTVWRSERHNIPAPEPCQLTASHADIIDYVLARYGRESGADLIVRTHAESPWRDIADANGGVPPIPSPVIQSGALSAFFAADEQYSAPREEQRQLVVLEPTQASDLAQEQVSALERGERLQLA